MSTALALFDIPPLCGGTVRDGSMHSTLFTKLGQGVIPHVCTDHTEKNLLCTAVDMCLSLLGALAFSLVASFSKAFSLLLSLLSSRLTLHCHDSKLLWFLPELHWSARSQPHATVSLDAIFTGDTHTVYLTWFSVIVLLC